MGISLAKMHARAAKERQVNEIINSPAFKAEMRKYEVQARMKAYAEFLHISCDFLELRHNYGKRGFSKFLKFAKDRLLYSVDDNPKYYSDMADWFRDTFNTDIFEVFGFDVEEE